MTLAKRKTMQLSSQQRCMVTKVSVAPKDFSHLVAIRERKHSLDGISGLISTVQWLIC